MIAARQELELRSALERLDRVVAASEGLDPDALTFAFRPLWQLDATTAATIALQKAQATQVYAGLDLWPAATMAKLVQAQLAEDGTYPNGQVVFGEGGAAGVVTDVRSVTDIPMAPLGSLPGAGRHGGEEQPRDWHGRYASWGDETDSSPDSPEIEQIGLGNRHDKRQVKRPVRPLGKGAFFGGVGRFLRRLWPEGSEPDEPNAPSVTQAPESSSTPSSIRPDPRAAQKLDNALSDYQTRRYTIDDQTFQLDKSGMRHTLEYWNGDGESQTLFRPGASKNETQDIAGDVLKQNRDEIITRPSGHEWQISGMSGGVEYRLSTCLGRVTQLYPLE